MTICRKEWLTQYMNKDERKVSFGQTNHIHRSGDGRKINSIHTTKIAATIWNHKFHIVTYIRKTIFACLFSVHLEHSYFIYLFICLFIYLFIYLFICLFIYLFIYLFIHSFIHLFIYLFIYIFVLEELTSSNSFNVFVTKSQVLGPKLDKLSDLDRQYKRKV